MATNPPVVVGVMSEGWNPSDRNPTGFVAMLFRTLTSLAFRHVSGSGTGMTDRHPGPLHPAIGVRDNRTMKDQDKLDRFLALCLRVYERMEREGSWPWGDSQEFGDVVESDSNQNNI